MSYQLTRSLQKILWSANDHAKGNSYEPILQLVPHPAALRRVVLRGGLGRDYNDDGKGIGFNVPSLLGAFATPPYYHNGAAESLLDVIADVDHRTANGLWPDRLSDPLDQLMVFAFLDGIDTRTVPFVPLVIRQNGSQVILSFDSIIGAQYGIQARTTITGAPSTVTSVAGNGQRLEVPVTITSATRFFQLAGQ